MKFRLDVEVDTSNGYYCKAVDGTTKCAFLRYDDEQALRGSDASCVLFGGRLNEEASHGIWEAGTPLRNAECRAAEAKAVIDEKATELAAKASVAVDAFNNAPQGDRSAEREAVRNALDDLARVAGHDYPEAVRLRSMMWVSRR